MDPNASSVFENTFLFREGADGGVSIKRHTLFHRIFRRGRSQNNQQGKPYCVTQCGSFASATRKIFCAHQSPPGSPRSRPTRRGATTGLAAPCRLPSPSERTFPPVTEARQRQRGYPSGGGIITEPIQPWYCQQKNGRDDAAPGLWPLERVQGQDRRKIPIDATDAR